MNVFRVAAVAACCVAGVSLTGCWTARTWSQANEPWATLGTVSGVTPRDAAAGPQSLVLNYRHTGMFDEDVYALVPLAASGEAVAPFGGGGERNLSELRALDPRRLEAVQRSRLGRLRYRRPAQAFGEKPPWRPAPSEDVDYAMPREPGARGPRAVVYWEKPPAGPSGRAAVMTGPDEGALLPGRHVVLVPSRQPRGRGAVRAAQLQATILTPGTVLLDAALAPVHGVAAVWNLLTRRG